MTKIDISPLLRTIIGFDQLTGLVAQNPEKAFPPYNIERKGDHAWLISIAVAGFAPGELTVEQRDRTLHVIGTKPEDSTEHFWLHRGIAGRSFERRFVLAEHVMPGTASIRDGILEIELYREVPEAAKPRTIEIRTTSAP